jgi:hypothetical protein
MSNGAGEDMLKINGRYWREYNLWLLMLRVLIMGIPALFTMVFEWLFDKSENGLLYLDRKLPDPVKVAE